MADHLLDFIFNIKRAREGSKHDEHILRAFVAEVARKGPLEAALVMGEALAALRQKELRQEAESN